MIYMLIVLVIHATAFSLGGVMRGIGMQKICTYIVFVAFYGVSMPIAYVMGKKYGLGLKGIWLGAIGGTITEIGIYLFSFAFLLKWDTLCV